MGQGVQEVSDINAVLRDLLLERGISEDSVEQLVDLVDRVAWVEACPRIPELHIWSRGALEGAIERLDESLVDVSRAHAPQRPYGLLFDVRQPTTAELSAMFREEWGPDRPMFPSVISYAREVIGTMDADCSVGGTRATTAT